jgi:hypothetical protein
MQRRKTTAPRERIGPSLSSSVETPRCHGLPAGPSQRPAVTEVEHLEPTIHYCGRQVQWLAMSMVRPSCWRSRSARSSLDWPVRAMTCFPGSFRALVWQCRAVHRGGTVCGAAGWCRPFRGGEGRRANLAGHAEFLPRPCLWRNPLVRI